MVAQPGFEPRPRSDLELTAYKTAVLPLHHWAGDPPRTRTEKTLLRRQESVHRSGGPGMDPSVGIEPALACLGNKRASTAHRGAGDPPRTQTSNCRFVVCRDVH